VQLARDPGEPGSSPKEEGGRSERDEHELLRQRLALFGQICSVANLLFFVGFQLLWSAEPTVGAARAWRATLSAGSVLTAVSYAALWLMPSARMWRRRALRAIELVGMVGLGIGFGGITLAHPVPSVSVWEMGLALTAILMLRSLLVPSSTLWTLCMGVVTSAPSTVAILAWPEHFPSAVAPKTMAMLVVNRSLAAIGCSMFASAVLHRLRRQVREARRLGQYTLEERLGEGGMGVVYRARHALLRRPTAIKLLRSASPATLERFESEVQLMARLSHPNTVAVHDYGRTEDGVFYYAMEYLDGLDLEQLCEMDGPQPGGRVIHLLRQACSALAEAHASGLIHRDIKPANIFVCHARTIADLVKVLDFGVVKDLRAVEAGNVTLAGALVGTPDYIAPESISHATPPDPRTDLYSLGAVAYRMLTGTPVFEGRTTMEICAHHLHSAPRPLHERTERSIAPDLAAVVLRCLEKAPVSRFASAAELSAALDGCVERGRWTPADAQTWWAEAAPRIASWRSARARAPSSDADSVIVAPHHHHHRSERQALRPWRARS
jgi:serine/threonine-protein kinase